MWLLNCTALISRLLTLLPKIAILSSSCPAVADARARHSAAEGRQLRAGGVISYYRQLVPPFQSSHIYGLGLIRPSGFALFKRPFTAGLTLSSMRIFERLGGALS